MSRLFTNIKQAYRQGRMPMRFIYINVGIFILTFLFNTLLMLFNQSGAEILRLFELPAWIERFLYQPWSLITYMFMHAGVLHLLFNMLWLYWFGQLFLYFYSERSFCGLYFFGGLCGGVLYMLFYNLFPYFSLAVYTSYLLGASASVLAITVATAVKEPNFRVRLLFFGDIRLKYIALVMVGMDLLLMTSGNAGGHIAHLGGALGGLWFALALQKGSDITKWINFLIDKIVNLFSWLSNPPRRKPKMKVHYNFREKDYDYNARKKAQSEEIDRILDKLKKSGYSSLTTEEKKSLFDASKK